MPSVADATERGARRALLRLAASHYGRARRTAQEIHVRFAALDRERAQRLEPAGRPAARRARRELAEIARMRRTLDRSMRVTTERLLALEHVIGALVAAPFSEPAPAPAPQSQAPAPAPSAERLLLPPARFVATSGDASAGPASGSATASE